MRYLVLLALLAAGVSEAQERVGLGYIVTGKEAVLFPKATGNEGTVIVPRGAAVLASDTWKGHGKEEAKEGRARVLYYVNGRDTKGGDHLGWMAESDLTKFWFACCGANCAGRRSDPSFPLTECFQKGASEASARLQPTPPASEELEKLRLQLEIEKLKLEQERVKAAAPTPTKAAESP